MLNGISPLISPELLKTLHEMGHADQLLLADAHFPAYTYGRRVLRADGLQIAPLLHAILPLFALDNRGNPFVMMQPDHPRELDPRVEEDYMAAIRNWVPNAIAPQRIARDSFYTLARSAFAILVTSELRPYGNILLSKGISIAG